MVLTLVFIVIAVIVGAVIAIKAEADSGGVAFAAMWCAAIGFVFALIPSGIIYGSLPESEYDHVEVQREEIATTESGDVTYFEIKLVDEDAYIYYMTKDGTIKNISVDKCNVELVESNYQVVQTKQKITSWKKDFVFPGFLGKTTTIYVPESVWLNANS